jgi:hypothetical protein
MAEAMGIAIHGMSPTLLFARLPALFCAFLCSCLPPESGSGVLIGGHRCSEAAADACAPPSWPPWGRSCMGRAILDQWSRVIMRIPIQAFDRHRRNPRVGAGWCDGWRLCRRFRIQWPPAHSSSILLRSNHGLWKEIERPELTDTLSTCALCKRDLLFNYKQPAVHTVGVLSLGVFCAEPPGFLLNNGRSTSNPEIY